MLALLGCVSAISEQKRLSVVMVSSWPPLHCGIASYSFHRLQAMLASADVSVVAVDGNATVFTSEVSRTVEKERALSYVSAASYVNSLPDVDLVLIEHEFGIFGGRAGEFILDFTRHLKVPYAVTLHTVVPAMSADMHRVLTPLVHGAAAVFVFNAKAHQIVSDLMPVDPERLHVVPHGAPSVISAVRSIRAVARRPLPQWVPLTAAQRTAQPVLSTFGFLGGNVNLQQIVRAVAIVARRFPSVLFVHAGINHPTDVAAPGIRAELNALVAELGMERNVVLAEVFPSNEGLAELLAATDIFVTAHSFKEQASSGTLSFAVAAGLPIVSTDFQLAQTLEAQGSSKLAPIGDADAFAKAILAFLENPQELAKARTAALAQDSGSVDRIVPLREIPLLRAAASRHAPSRRSEFAVLQTTNVTLSQLCLGACADNLATTLSAVSTAAGTAGTSAAAQGTCGALCTQRRSLFQTVLPSNELVITLPGATAAQASQLQSQILAGNLVGVGIPPTTVVVATSPSGQPLVLTPIPVALNPSNPSPLNPLSLCSSTTATFLPCVAGLANCEALQTALAKQSTPIYSQCCGCTVTGRQLPGFRLAVNLALARLCVILRAAGFRNIRGCGKQSKKGLLGLLGLLGLIPLLLCLLICCLCLLRRKRRGQAMLFSQTAVPAPLPAPMPHVHAAPVHSHGPGDFHVHP
jgi:glycosyltransferase involved in cell wall biosynthesis